MAKGSLSSFLFGGIVGAAIGMSVISRMDGDSKSKLVEKGKEFAHKASKKVEEATDKLEGDIGIDL